MPATIKVFADGLIPFFEGELTVAKMFNRRWQNREEGVSQFVQQLPDAFKKASEQNQLAQFNTSVLSALAEILKDKVQQVVTRSFEAIDQYKNQM